MTYNVFSGTLNPTHFTSLYEPVLGDNVEELEDFVETVRLRKC